MPFSIAQTGTGHHGVLGVPASALVVLKSKLACVHVAVYPSNVLEKAAMQSYVQVYETGENTIQITFCLFV